MKNFERYKIWLLLTLLLFIILVNGCKKQYTKITIEEYNRLINVEKNYKQLSQNYTILKIQSNQCKKELQNVSNILFNILAYEKPIEITNPITSEKYIINYPDSTEIARTSFWTTVWTFIIEFILALGFFIADKSKRKWATAMVIVLVFWIGVILIKIGNIILN